MVERAHAGRRRLVGAHLGDELARPAFQGPVAVDQAVHHVAARPFQVAEVVQELVGDLELEEARVDQGVGVDGDEARAPGRAGGGLVAGVEALDPVHPPRLRRLAPQVAPERARPRLVVERKTIGISPARIASSSLPTLHDPGFVPCGRWTGRSRGCRAREGQRPPAGRSRSGRRRGSERPLPGRARAGRLNGRDWTTSDAQLSLPDAGEVQEPVLLDPLGADLLALGELGRRHAAAQRHERR